jgi:hypothetical protein
MNENLPGMYAVGREFEISRRPDWDQVFFAKVGTDPPSFLPLSDLRILA